MKLGEIYLSEELTEQLSALLAAYNQDVSPEKRKTYQQLAEALLEDAIRTEYRYKVK